VRVAAHDRGGGVRVAAGSAARPPWWRLTVALSRRSSCSLLAGRSSSEVKVHRERSTSTRTVELSRWGVQLLARYSSSSSSSSDWGSKPARMGHAFDRSWWLTRPLTEASLRSSATCVAGMHA
jgi:hypothetical protein